MDNLTQQLNTMYGEIGDKPTYVIEEIDGQKVVCEYQLRKYVRQDIAPDTIDNQIAKLNSTVEQLESLKNELNS